MTLLSCLPAQLSSSFVGRTSSSNRTGVVLDCSMFYITPFLELLAVVLA